MRRPLRPLARGGQPVRRGEERGTRTFREKVRIPDPCLALRLGEFLVEHQRIVVRVVEGEQPDHVRNVADRAVLADALSVQLGLKQMLQADFVDRALEDDFPPIAIYGLTGRGRDLAAAMR